MLTITEKEFNRQIKSKLTNLGEVGCVTGPGRSGAVAAVYASHILRVPFIPYGSQAPTNPGTLLIIDTAVKSGKTLRKAAKKYRDNKSVVIYIYKEPPRVAFWYEAHKPQLKKVANSQKENENNN